MEKLEEFLEFGGTQKDIAFLAVSGAALMISIFDLLPLPFYTAWVELFCAESQLFWKR